jgi:hypothetical protein
MKILLDIAIPLLLATSSWGSAAYSQSQDLQITGRVTDVSGQPQAGPVDLLIKFFDAPKGGKELGGSLSKPGVYLVQGIFQLPLGLTSSERNTIFAPGKNVWMEITDTTNGKTFARQAFSAVPYALRVPVDGTTITWTSDGELKAVASGSGGSGTITGITAGTGLTGGGTSGSVTLNVDQSSLAFGAGQITSGVLATARLPSAGAGSSGILSSADWNTFNNKEPAMAAGDGTQYLDGTKSWQTLDTSTVPENGSLYFTDARARSAVVTSSITNGVLDRSPSEDVIYDQIIGMKDVATGFAGLDGSGKIAASALPLGGLNYQGTWNANTNTPPLATPASCGTQGHYYITSVGGSTNLDGIASWSLGDWAICGGGGLWQRVGNSTGGVTTVNSKTGATINLNTDDIPQGSANNYYPSGDATKMDYLTVTQAVNLDTVESGVSSNTTSIGTNGAGISANASNISTNTTAIALNTAKNTYPSGDATKVGHLTVTQSVNLDTMETAIGTNTTNISSNASSIGTNTSAIALNTAKNSYPSGDATKMGHLTVTQAVNLDTMESAIGTNTTDIGSNTSAIALNTAKSTYPSGDATKVGHLTVTQAVNLDTMETAIGANSTNIGSNTTALSGLVIGTDVQAYDASLASLAGLATTANRMIYTTGANAYAETPITTVARNLLDDTTVNAQRSTLGAAQSGANSDITSLTGLTDSSSILANDPSPLVFKVINSSTSSSANAMLRLGQADAAGLDIYRVGNSADVIFDATQGNGKIRFQDAGADTLTIGATGFVGIGTTNPMAPLHVSATTLNAFSQYTTNATGHNGGDGLWVGADTSGKGHVWNYEATDLMLATSNAVRMTVNANGNVGIGTATADEKLQVQGAIKIVDGNQGLGKVLTSNGDGVASWQTPASNGDVLNNALLTIRTADQSSGPGFETINGFVDGYNDTLAIDGGATDIAHDNSSNAYRTISGYTATVPALNTNQVNEHTNFSHRNIISSSDLSSGGNAVRIRLQGSTVGGSEMTIDNVAIVERSGSTGNGVTTPTEILFGGSSGVTLDENGAWSDLTNFTVDPTKNYLLICDYSASGQDNRYTASGDGSYYKLGDTYNVASPSGLSFQASHLYTVDKLEVYTVVASGTLQSNAIEAGQEPTDAEIFILGEDVDPITLGTDLTAEISIDDGANWESLVLTEEYAFGNGQKLWKGTASGLTDRNDKTIKYRLMSGNTKNITINSVYLTWSGSQ